MLDSIVVDFCPQGFFAGPEIRVPDPGQNKGIFVFKTTGMLLYINANLF